MENKNFSDKNLENIFEVAKLIQNTATAMEKTINEISIQHEKGELMERDFTLLDLRAMIISIYKAARQAWLITDNAELKWENEFLKQEMKNKDKN
ncbi:MAG: hypothetical protein LBM19_03985 [Holosporales bacterium]|jgi:hypothetical protein|nr:hypothetical protein [Holosporales bacterium]